MVEKADRERAMEQAISQIERQFGRGSIMKMGLSLIHISEPTRPY